MSDGSPTWNPGLGTYLHYQRWPAGTASYSTPPTMAEINAGTGLNQMVAYLNRKQAQTTGAAAIPYVSSRQPYAASALTTLRTAINTLRAAIGLSASGFTTDAKYHTLNHIVFDELQNSLALTVTFSNNSNTLQKSVRNSGGVYPLFGGTDTYSTSTSGYGKQSATPNTNRFRFGTHFLLGTIGTSADATFGFSAAASDAGETNNPRLYLSNTDDSAFVNGWQNNLDNLCGDAPYGDGPQTISISNAVLSIRSGGKASFVLGTNTELTSTGSGLVNAGFSLASLASIPVVLTINY